MKTLFVLAAWAIVVAVVATLWGCDTIEVEVCYTETEIETERDVEVEAEVGAETGEQGEAPETEESEEWEECETQDDCQRPLDSDQYPGVCWMIACVVGRCVPVPADYDQDGYAPDFCEYPDGPGQDCDYLDQNVHPNAPEICDAVDSNCDGNLDEGLSDLGACITLVQVYFGTFDETAGSVVVPAPGRLYCANWSDGYGGTDSGLVCTPDCLMEEAVANGLDDNCNGEIDEE